MDEVRLHVHGEHLVDEASPRLSGPRFQSQIPRNAGERFGVGIVLDVYAATPQQFLPQGQARPGRREVDDVVAHGNLHTPVNVLGQS